MNVNRKILTVAAFLVAFGIESAGATPIYVEPTSATSSVAVSLDQSVCLPVDSCTMSVQHNFAATLDGTGAWLADGASWTFDFFDLTVNGVGAATGTIEATLAFLSPIGSATSTGTGGVVSVPLPLVGIVSGGVLNWGAPGQIALQGGGWLSIRFSDLLQFGVGNRATVTATVTHYKSVPEPGTLVLLGIGLLGLALAGKGRSAT